MAIIEYKSDYGHLENTGSHLQYRDKQNHIQFSMTSDPTSLPVAIERAKHVSTLLASRSNEYVDADAATQSDMLDKIDPDRVTQRADEAAHEAAKAALRAKATA